MHVTVLCMNVCVFDSFNRFKYCTSELRRVYITSHRLETPAFFYSILFD